MWKRQVPSGSLGGGRSEPSSDGKRWAMIYTREALHVEPVRLGFVFEEASCPADRVLSVAPGEVVAREPEEPAPDPSLGRCRTTREVSRP